MMNLNGHGLRDHIRLVAPLCGVIAAVFVLREVSFAAGAPAPVVHAISVSVAIPTCVMLAVLLIHIRRFGGYANVILSALLLVLCGQILIVGAIAFSAITKVETVYSGPEYSFRALSPLDHIIGQLTFVVGFQTISAAAMGCLLLWMLRKLPQDPAREKRR
jgi:hypothetical protein